MTKTFTVTKKTATSPENLVRIDKTLLNISTLMGQLADRWSDEKEYEDIADYGARIKRELPEGFTLTKMTKRPFGFEFNIGTEAVYACFVKSRGYGWKRIS